MRSEVGLKISKKTKKTKGSLLLDHFIAYFFMQRATNACDAEIRPTMREANGVQALGRRGVCPGLIRHDTVPMEKIPGRLDPACKSKFLARPQLGTRSWSIRS